MQIVSIAFGLDFQCSTEIFIMGIRMRHTEFIISRSISKNSVDINERKSRKKQNVTLAFGFLI